VVALGFFWLSSVYPVVVLAVLLGSLMLSLLFWKHDEARRVALLLFFVIVNLAVLVLVVPTAYFRYLAPLFPIAAILIAVIIDQGIQRHLVLGSLVLIVALMPTKLTGEYLYEITHTYKGPMDGVVQYLQTHGSEKDTVLITYGDITLAFYTRMKIVGGLTGEDPTPYTNPTWIIVRKYPMGLADSALRRHIQTRIPWEKYERITLPFPDILYQNREDPRYHHFRTETNEEGVRIFRRM
jgi:prepilin signal peptidase PulO-like enzyme (type II secretory pathway)